jgi:hypothetical protein
MDDDTAIRARIAAELKVFFESFGPADEDGGPDPLPAEAAPCPGPLD